VGIKLMGFGGLRRKEINGNDKQLSLLSF